MSGSDHGVVKRWLGSFATKAAGEPTKAFTVWIDAETTGHISALLSRIASLEGENAEMRAALKPFADRCDESVHFDDSDTSGVTVRVVHLRRARALLPNVKPDSEPTS